MGVGYMQNKGEHMNYDYGKSRDWYHVYALVDPTDNKPRYFGELWLF